MTTTEIRPKINTLLNEMSERHIQMESPTYGLAVGLLSGMHVELLGPPGTNKSRLVRDFTSYLDAGNHFYWLMSQFSEPNEILGPVSIKALKDEDVHRRITTGKLPEATTAFLDEIYKANSSILNALLSILLERSFKNDGYEIVCPLIMCIGASNEIPEKGSGLDALRDRMVLRYNISAVRETEDLEAMLALPELEIADMERKVSLTAEDISSARAIVKAMPISTEAIQSLNLVWERVHEEGIVPSPRRYKQLTRIMAADSYLRGYDQVMPESLYMAAHVLWEEPGQIAKVSEIVRTSIDPYGSKAQDILTAAKEAYADVGRYTPAEEVLGITRTLQSLREEVTQMPESDTTKAIAEKLLTMTEELMRQAIQSARGS
jgi:MoxR-like ATPase